MLNGGFDFDGDGKLNAFEEAAALYAYDELTSDDEEYDIYDDDEDEEDEYDEDDDDEADDDDDCYDDEDDDY